MSEPESTTDGKMSDEDLIKLLGSLDDQQLIDLKQTVKLEQTKQTTSPKKYTTNYVPVEHHYHCEVCFCTNTKIYKVKVTKQMKAAEVNRKPLNLYTICEKCRKKIIIGLALATMMVEEKITHECGK
jgi:hypothetical protein